MNKFVLEEIIKAIASTNLGLQNSIGNYAQLAAKAIEGEMARQQRMVRIEEKMDKICGLLVEVNVDFTTLMKLVTKLEKMVGRVRKKKSREKILVGGQRYGKTFK